MHLYPVTCQMWLLIVFLAVLDSFRGYMYVIAMDHKYTDTWAVQICKDVNEAMRIAEKYGFTYKMKVPVRVLRYSFQQ